MCACALQGGTAVGTGLNSPEGFDVEIANAVRLPFPRLTCVRADIKHAAVAHLPVTGLRIALDDVTFVGGACADCQGNGLALCDRP
jgi:fumarate hydratase class II